MADSWIKDFENLQNRYSGLPEVEKLFKKDFQWLDGIHAEALTVFEKENTLELSESEPNEDNVNYCIKVRSWIESEDSIEIIDKK